MFLDHKQFYRSYDPGASVVYGRLGRPDGLPVRGKWGVQTSGSSTTVTATDGTPFAPVTVGSTIVFLSPRPDGKIVRRVTAKASPTSITVDSAVTLAAGTAWFWVPFKSGTAATDGWHLVTDLSAITVFVDVETLASTTVVATIQAGGGPGAAPQTLTTLTFSAAGQQRYDVTSVVQSLRVGLATTGDAAGDAVSAWLKGEQLQTGG